jgi:hypothetical protein
VVEVMIISSLFSGAGFIRWPGCRAQGEIAVGVYFSTSPRRSAACGDVLPSWAIGQGPLQHPHSPVRSSIGAGQDHGVRGQRPTVVPH